MKNTVKLFCLDINYSKDFDFETTFLLFENMVQITNQNLPQFVAQ